MNQYLKTALLLSAFTISTNVSAKEYFVALSPFENPSTARAQVEGLITWVVQLNSGDKVTFLDGYNLRTLGKFEVPESAIYNSPRARLNANREPVAKLLQFAEQVSLPSGDGEPSIRGAILLPQLLRQIALLPVESNEHETIIIASAVYDHPSQPQWSMAGRRFPGDGNIFNSRSESPYAAADSPEILNGFRVHIAYDEASGGMEVDSYAFRVQRYWTLFVEAQGGQLVSFTNELQTALQRAKLDAPAMPHQFEAQLVATGESTIYERPILQEALSRQELRQAHGVSIGLTWDCSSCDLDLYSRYSPSAEVLFYGNPSTREGTVRKEFPLSYQDTGNRGFETIYYTVGINLEELAIGVNFYEGSAPDGVTAELRIDVGGKTYAKSLYIPASTGNQGVGALSDIQRGSSSSEQTLLITPLDVIIHD